MDFSYSNNRFLKLLFASLILISGIAGAQTLLTIEDPAGDSDVSGIGLLAGWAISDTGIESIELLIDGVSVGYAPYGGNRFDVADAFPEYLNAGAYGWAMNWAHSKQAA